MTVPPVKLAASMIAKSNKMGSRLSGRVLGARVVGGTAAGRELTCTVSVSVTLPFAGNAGAEGLKAQVDPLGTFRHCRLTVPVAPFTELSVIPKLAAWPTDRVADVGDMLPLKSGDASTTSVAEKLCVMVSHVVTTVNG